MKFSKAIRKIIGICAVSGVAVIAYKIGESDGRQKERHRITSENIDYYDDMDYDEKDDECITPRRAVYEVQRE